MSKNSLLKAYLSSKITEIQHCLHYTSRICMVFAVIRRENYENQRFFFDFHKNDWCTDMELRTCRLIHESVLQKFDGEMILK
jgi:hypothetical protein